MSREAATAPGLACPTTLLQKDAVLLGHGSGGKLSAQLVRDIFLPAFRNSALDALNDQAVVEISGSRIAFTTDSFVVKPLFFPGGDIGSLAVHGTINDLAMGGATPRFLSVALIIEEGFPLETLRKIVDSIQRAASSAGVCVVTGDTKVVEKGSGDGIFVNTSGIGILERDTELSANRARPGDSVILSGSIGDHGIAIMAQREGIDLETTIESDSAPLHTLVQTMLETNAEFRCFRDPTRGGLSSALNEIAAQSEAGFEIEERAIPIREEVRGACEILGLDPLYVANEGKLIAIVAPGDAEKAIQAMKQHPMGRDASIIGKVCHAHPGMVTLRTTMGTTRIVDMLSGDQLPRIC